MENTAIYSNIWHCQICIIKMINRQDALRDSLWLTVLINVKRKSHQIHSHKMGKIRITVKNAVTDDLDYAHVIPTAVPLCIAVITRLWTVSQIIPVKLHKCAERMTVTLYCRKRWRLSNRKVRVTQNQTGLSAWHILPKPQPAPDTSHLQKHTRDFYLEAKSNSYIRSYLSDAHS